LSWASRQTFASIGLRTRDYLRALQPATTGCAAMILAVTAVIAAAPVGWSPGLRLATQIATGMTVYPLVLILLHRDRLKRMTKVISMLRAPR
jgi:cyanophycinase-like exopeptidase